MNVHDSDRLPHDLQFFLEQVGEAVKECLAKKFGERTVPQESKEDEDGNDQGGGVFSGQ